MKLYSLPLSPFAARVRGVIYAKDLPVEIAAAPAEWSRSAAFRQLNPAGRIPVLLLDDGTPLPESAVIVEYLEDAFPQPPLRPADPAALARVRLITQVADIYVMQAMMPLFHLFDQKVRDEAAIRAQLDKLDQGLAHLNGMLEAGSYAASGRLTTADMWLAPVRFTLDGLMGFSGRMDLLDRHKAIAGYADLAQRHSVLGRVWRELSDGLKSFMAKRAETAGKAT